MKVIDNKTGKVLENVTVIDAGKSASKFTYRRRDELIERAVKGMEESSKYILDTRDYEGYAKMKARVDIMWQEATEYENSIMLSMWDGCLFGMNAKGQVIAHSFMEESLNDPKKFMAFKEVFANRKQR